MTTGHEPLSEEPEFTNDDKRDGAILALQAVVRVLVAAESNRDPEFRARAQYALDTALSQPVPKTRPKMLVHARRSFQRLMIGSYQTQRAPQGRGWWQFWRRR